MLEKYRGFVIDENLDLPSTDKDIFMDTTVYTSTDFFEKGTPDDKIIDWLVESKYILVTQDVRMSTYALLKDVPVLFISISEKYVKLLITVDVDESEYMELKQYFHRRLNFGSTA